jgi:hypothetical protein
MLKEARGSEQDVVRQVNANLKLEAGEKCLVDDCMYFNRQVEQRG